MCQVLHVPVVELMYLVFTRMPGESYRRRLRSLLLYLCYVFRVIRNSLCVDSDRVLWVLFCFRLVIEHVSTDGKRFRILTEVGFRH